MNKYWCTFGCGMLHAGYIVEIHADTREQAEEKMFMRYGRQWAFLYTDYEKLDPLDRRHGVLAVLV